MTHDARPAARLAAATSALATDEPWRGAVERMGGHERLDQEGRELKAFERARACANAVAHLRLVLAYCLGKIGLRLTAAQAEALGLASLSATALMNKVRKTVPWLEALVARQIMTGTGTPSAAGAPQAEDARPAAAHGRLVRLVDGSTVAKKGAAADGEVWRLHAVLDLPTERFSAFELTDESVGEQFDRAAVIPGEIRIGDRYFLQPARMANVKAQGGDFIVRARWNAARWLLPDGRPLDLIKALEKASERGFIDRPIAIGRDKAEPMPVRLVAIRKPEAAREASIAKARRKAAKNGSKIMPQTLVAAEWMILVTSLQSDPFTRADIGALYRLRWRIEIAFKHTKSISGLDQPPADNPDSAKAWVLSHLLLHLLTEPPLAEHLGDSPRRPAE